MNGLHCKILHTVTRISTKYNCLCIESNSGERKQITKIKNL